MTSDGIQSYFAKIGLDTTEFTGGMQKSSSSILQFYRDVSVSIGATMFVFDKLMAYGQEFVDLANKASEFVSTIDKLSVTTGLSNDELQRWSNVAKYADSDISTLSYSLRKLQLNLNEVGSTGDTARSILDQMGVSYKNADGSLKSMNEIFPDVIEGIKNLSSSSDRNTAANALFGRSYQDLTGYMVMTKSEMEGYYESANTLTEEQQQKLRDYETATKDLNSTMSTLANTAGSDLAPAMQEWTDLLNNDLLQNGGAIDTFFKNLDGFLIAAARGFHILGAEAMTIAQTMKGDFTGAIQTQKDLGSWIQSESTQDALKASGYSEGKVWDAASGKWVTPTTAKSTGTSLNLNTDTEDTDTEDKLAQAYKDLTSATEDLTDEMKSMEDINKEYQRSLAETDIGDVQSFRRLTIQHTYDVQDQQEKINTAVANVAAAKTEYGDVVVNVEGKTVAKVTGVAAGTGKTYAQWQGDLTQSGAG